MWILYIRYCWAINCWKLLQLRIASIIELIRYLQSSWKGYHIHGILLHVKRFYIFSSTHLVVGHGTWQCFTGLIKPLHWRCHLPIFYGSYTSVTVISVNFLYTPLVLNLYTISMYSTRIIMSCTRVLMMIKRILRSLHQWKPQGKFVRRLNSHLLLFCLNNWIYHW